MTTKPLPEERILIVALGSFGAKVLEAIDSGCSEGLRAPTAPPIWAGPEGWQLRGKAAPVEPHPAGAQDVLRSALQSGRFAAGAPPHFLLIFHLQENFQNTFWRQAVEHIRQSLPAFSAGQITLLAGLDSSRLHELAVEEANQFRDSIRLLADDLQHGGGAARGRLDDCYLIDSLDLFACPIAPFAPTSGQNLNQEELQAQQIAAIIFAFTAGLLDAPAFRRTNLMNVASSFRGLPPVCRVSTAGVGILHFPAIWENRQTVTSTASRLLSEHLSGVVDERVESIARDSCIEWRQTCGWTRAILAQRLRFAPDEPFEQLLAAGPDWNAEPEYLTDSFDRWTEQISKAWRYDGSGTTSLEQRAERILAYSQSWLTRHSRAWLERTPRGARICLEFISAADHLLQTLTYTSLEADSHQAARRNLSWRLFAAISSLVPQEAIDVSTARELLGLAASRWEQQERAWSRFTGGGIWKALLLPWRLLWLAVALAWAELSSRRAEARAIRAVRGAYLHKEKAARAQVFNLLLQRAQADLAARKEQAGQALARLAPAQTLLEEHHRIAAQPPRFLAQSSAPDPSGKQLIESREEGDNLARQFLAQNNPQEPPELADALLKFCAKSLQYAAEHSAGRLPGEEMPLDDLPGAPEPLLQLNQMERMQHNNFQITYRGIPADWRKRNATGESTDWFTSNSPRRVWFVKKMFAIDLLKLRIWELLPGGPRFRITAETGEPASPELLHPTPALAGGARETASSDIPE